MREGTGRGPRPGRSPPTPRPRAAALLLPLLIASVPAARADAGGATTGAAGRREPPAERAADPPGAHRQVITGEEIRRAGLIRLTEALRLADGWRLASVDGFTWRASPRGLAPFGRQGWRILVDGQEVEVDLLGVRNPDRLPVPLSEVDSVVVISSPALAAGELSSGGVVEFHTRTVPRGLAVAARGLTGNETGDPGPFRMTELATPNVDRFGEAFAASAAWGAGDLGARASFVFRQHFATDPAIRARNTDVQLGAQPLLRVPGASASVVWTPGTARHRLLLLRSELEDLFLLPPLGRELPTESDLLHLGLDGRIPLGRTGSAPTLRYELRYAEDGLEERPNAPDLDFDWRVRRPAARVEISGGEGARGAGTEEPLGWRAGLEVEHERAETSFPLSDPSVTVGRATAGLGLAVGEGARGRLSLTGELTASEDGLTPAIAAGLAWPAGAGGSLEALLSYEERPAAEDDRIWKWRLRGYRFLERAGRTVSVEPGVSGGRLATAEAAWRLRPARGVSLRLGGFLRHFRDLALEELAFRFRPADASFASPEIALRTGLGGEVAGGEIRAEARPSRLLTLRASASVAGSVGGDSLFREEWTPVPDAQLRISAGYDPVPSFGLWARIGYRSGTTWPAYRGIDGETDGEYSAAVPEAVIVEAAVQKWLWDRRLRLAVAFRNLMDETLRSHPIGVTTNLTLLAQGELRLGPF